MNKGRTARPVAVLDIGTNSIKLLVATTDGTRVRTRHFARVTTRLGAGLDHSGGISDAAAGRTVRAVRSLAAQARRHRATRVLAVGTYALRTARNGAAVARKIERATGVEVRVLTGREEAQLAFRSARAHLGATRPVTFLLDVGGGSAQFVAARGNMMILARSLPLGALRLTERHLHHDPIDPADYARMQREIDRALRPLLAQLSRLSPRATLIAVGGSATTVLAMAGHHAATRRPEGTVGIGTLRRVERACLERTAAARTGLPGLPADRADIIPAGIAVLIAFMTAARKRVVHITRGGVREGAILSMRKD